MKSNRNTYKNHITKKYFIDLNFESRIFTTFRLIEHTVAVGDGARAGTSVFDCSGELNGGGVKLNDRGWAASRHDD